MLFFSFVLFCSLFLVLVFVLFVVIVFLVLKKFLLGFVLVVQNLNLETWNLYLVSCFLLLLSF